MIRGYTVDSFATTILKHLREKKPAVFPQVAERMGLLAEIQKVSVLFIGLSFEGDGVKAPPMEAWVNGNSGLSQSTNERNRGADTVEGVVSAKSVEKLSILQASFALMQIVVSRHQGVIKELSVDDKGTVSIFGSVFSNSFGNVLSILFGNVFSNLFGNVFNNLFGNVLGSDLLVTSRVASTMFSCFSRFNREFASL